MTPTPITIVTGSLGAGKTTLVNALLAGDHGLRIGVIVNEFGEVAIDHELVMNVEEEDVVVLANGCACCTVRDDMIDALEQLFDADLRLDHIVIETSGLATPGPVVMTLLSHPDASERFVVDGVIALADALHLEAALASGGEAAEQIAYADVVLLNRSDTASAAAIESAERAIAALNPVVLPVRTSFAAADPHALLAIGGLDPRRTEELIAAMRPGGGHRDDPHDHGISAASMVWGGAIDPEAFGAWLDRLLAEHHGDILRIKGMLDVAGQSRRYVVQSVHALWTWSYGRPWGETPRENRLVVIGRGIDRAMLEAGLAACTAERIVAIPSPQQEGPSGHVGNAV